MSASGVKGPNLPNGYHYEWYDWERDEDASGQVTLVFTQSPNLTTTVNGVVYPVWVSNAQRTYEVVNSSWAADIIDESTGQPLQDGDTFQYTGNVMYLFATLDVDENGDSPGTTEAVWTLTTDVNEVSGTKSQYRFNSYAPYYTNNGSLPDITTVNNTEMQSYFGYDYADFANIGGMPATPYLTYNS